MKTAGARPAVILLLIVILGLPAVSAAESILISDPFPGSQYNTPGYDVIGERTDFDIQYAEFQQITDTGQMTVALALNYRNAAVSGDQLAGWNYSSIHLNVGDLLFGVNDSWKYGVVVGDHAGSPNGGAYATGGALARGGFYEILDPSLATLTAKDALNNPGGAVYRPNAAVWLYDDPTTTSDLSYLGSGVVAINGFGNGTDDAEFLVTISGIPVTESFLQDLVAFGMTVQFASATCGNDLLTGRIDDRIAPVPEPGTLMLLGSGLIGLAGWGRKKFRR